MNSLSVCWLTDCALCVDWLSDSPPVGAAARIHVNWLKIISLHCNGTRSTEKANGTIFAKRCPLKAPVDECGSVRIWFGGGAFCFAKFLHSLGRNLAATSTADQTSAGGCFKSNEALWMVAGCAGWTEVNCGHTRSGLLVGERRVYRCFCVYWISESACRIVSENSDASWRV